MHRILFALAGALLIQMVPTVTVADQSDQRLDTLFNQLRESANNTEQRQAEVEIWGIWFESGSEQVDELMDDAGEQVKAGNLKAAESIYTDIINLAPGFSEVWNRRATGRYYMQDFDGSLDDIEQTLRLEPRHFGAIWGLGMILGQRQNFAEAIAAFERLLEIKPNSQDARPRIELLKKEMKKGAV